MIVAHRLDDQGDPSESAEALALADFMRTKGGRNFEEFPHHSGDPQLKAHSEAVERSDAVILLGGKEGTYAAGLSALLRRKMIITIPAFGGSARDLCEIEEINRIYHRRQMVEVDGRNRSLGPSSRRSPRTPGY